MSYFCLLSLYPYYIAKHSFKSTIRMSYDTTYTNNRTISYRIAYIPLKYTAIPYILAIWRGEVFFDDRE